MDQSVTFRKRGLYKKHFRNQTKGFCSVVDKTQDFFGTPGIYVYYDMTPLFNFLCFLYCVDSKQLTEKTTPE